MEPPHDQTPKLYVGGDVRARDLFAFMYLCLVSLFPSRAFFAPVTTSLLTTCLTSKKANKLKFSMCTEDPFGHKKARKPQRKRVFLTYESLLSIGICQGLYHQHML